MKAPSEVNPMSSEHSHLVEQLTAIREQLATMHQQLVAIWEQQKTLCALVTQLQLRSGETGKNPGPRKDISMTHVQEILADCAQDLLRVLREVGHPLNMLEILEELVKRQLRWRESTVSHTLVELVDHGILTDTGESGLHRYALTPRS
jgi:hypothetical protein